MSIVTTDTSARATLAVLCDEVASTRETVIIRRRNAEDLCGTDPVASSCFAADAVEQDPQP